MDLIVLYTKTPITYEKTIGALRGEFPIKRRILADTPPSENYNGQFCYGVDSSFDEIWLTFEPNQKIFEENDLLLSDEEKTLIPFDGYYVYVYFWNDEYAKRLVECLLPIYPEMLVDDDNGNIVSGANYLKSQYIHNFLHARKGEYYDPNNKHK